MTDQRFTIAELDRRRADVEAQISFHYSASLVGASDAQHADWERRMFELHEQLVSVFEALEMAAWREAPAVAPAIRWAITGARLRGETHRDLGIAWRRAATGEATAR